MVITRGESRKDSKTKWKFHGEELLGPQASLRVTPCPPAPNHTRGEVIRPPSQIKNNSYSVIRTRDLDDLSSTRCAPTTTARPSGNYTKLKVSIVERKQLCYFVTRYVSEQSKTPFAEGHLHVMNCK